MSASNQPNQERAIVIMAGGVGERFWPVSNRSTPKQLLRLHGGKSLLRASFDRACGVVDANRVYVVAGADLREAILGDLPELGPENYITEPAARNTAACLGLAACHLEAALGPDAVMGVLTADHVIEEGEAFRSTIAAALGHAAGSGDLVTIGIEPTRADTGFGYLELGDSLGDGTGDASQVFRVRRFREKPDLEEAEAFLAQGNFYWNSGMFFWTLGALFDAFSTHQPEMAATWDKFRAGTGEIREFEQLPRLPIDKAIMEKADNVAVVRAGFGWEDVGSWDSLSRVLSLDESGNCTVGKAILIDSENNIIYNDFPSGEPSGELVVCGVEGLVIVRTEKATLIVPKSEAQKVRDVVAYLKRIGREDLL